jgi:hypothetical protein
MFDELGVSVDVPELHPDMTEEDLAAAAARLADGMRRAEEQRTSQPASYRQTKRERHEEERAHRFEQLRKDNIGHGDCLSVPEWRDDEEQEDTAYRAKSPIDKAEPIPLRTGQWNLSRRSPLCAPQRPAGRRG